MKELNFGIKKYSFKEKQTTLAARIDAHKKFSKFEINDWILKIIQLQKGERILDVGCGTGKQAIPYKKIVGEKGIVIGTDISEEIIDEAKKNAKMANVEVQFLIQDANNSFDFPNNYFNVISCCFAIYYIKNLDKIIQEFKRLLKQGGRVFLAGPTPENAKLLHDLHQKITQKSLPYMPGISRFMSEVLSLMHKHFQNIKINKFQNPLIFKDLEPFLEYYTSTGLFIDTIKDDNEKKNVIERMKLEIQKLIQEKGKIEITKEVGGILAYKE